MSEPIVRFTNVTELEASLRIGGGGFISSTFTFDNKSNNNET